MVTLFFVIFSFISCFHFVTCGLSWQERTSGWKDHQSEKIFSIEFKEEKFETNSKKSEQICETVLKKSETKSQDGCLQIENSKL